MSDDVRSVPVPGADVLSDDLDGERLLWRGGTLRALDRVGSLVWPHLDGRTPVCELADEIASVFGTPREVVEADLLDLCHALCDAGYVTWGPADDAPPVSVPATTSPVEVQFGTTRPPSRPDVINTVTTWYPTGRHVVLTHDFEIRCSDRWLSDYFGRRLAPFATEGPARSLYSVIDTGVEGPGRFETYLDRRGLLRAADRDLVVRHLLWHVNQQVIREDIHHLLVHSSGAASPEGSAVVLPGAMNAGKSTLVAALTDRGLHYITDEIVALEVGSGDIVPYPRPLNLGHGSWGLLPHLRPPDWSPDDPVPRSMWHVVPSALGSSAGRSRIGYVVAPRYVAGEGALLTSVSRAEGAEIVYRNAFNARERDASGYRTLVDAMRSARCARLEFGDLEAAVDAVVDFMST